MAATDTSLDDFLGQLYDAAVGSRDWREVLQALARLFGATAAVLGIVGPHSAGRLLQVGLDPALLSLYLQRHAGRNELARRTATLPVGAVVTDRCVMPKAEFRRSAFYGDCLRPLGLDSLLNLRAANGEAGVVANVCLLRNGRQDEFGEQEAGMLRRISPHLQRAVAVQLRLAEAAGEQRALEQALDQLARAVYIVDGSGALLRTNAAGSSALAARDGLRCDPGEGSALRAARPEETAALRDLIASAAQGRSNGRGGPGYLRLSRPPPKPPLAITALPLTAAGAAIAGLPPAAAVLLLVADPELRGDAPSPALLRQTFGLTKAEAEIAVRAAHGDAMPAVAASLGIAPGTARLHLHRVLEKTGAHRQAELTAILARLVA